MGTHSNFYREGDILFKGFFRGWGKRKIAKHKRIPKILPQNTFWSCKGQAPPWKFSPEQAHELPKQGCQQSRHLELSDLLIYMKYR